MSNEVTASQAPGGLSFAVPASIAARLKAAGANNIVDRSTTNSLTFKGKVWTTHINGESKVLQRKVPVLDDDDKVIGYEEENAPSVRAIVLAMGEYERSYYAGNFEGTARQPDCWSRDNRKPDPSIGEPPSTACDTCPMAAKGSGKDGKGYACGKYKPLVVILGPNSPAMRLKFKGASDWDTQDEEAIASGWYAWKNYADFLRANGLQFTGAVVTQIRFANTQYPKLQFKLDKFVDDTMIDHIVARSQSDEVKKLLDGYTAQPKPQGKPLPQDEATVDGPTGWPAPGKTAEAEKGIAADLIAKAEAKALQEAEAAQKAERAARDKAKAKAAAEAAALEAARLAADAEAEEADGWDEPATSPVTVLPPAQVKETEPPKRVTKPKLEVTSAAPIEVSGSLASTMLAWE